jgi:hypothetical protein
MWHVLLREFFFFVNRTQKTFFIANEGIGKIYLIKKKKIMEPN